MCDCMNAWCSSCMRGDEVRPFVEVAVGSNSAADSDPGALLIEIAPPSEEVYELPSLSTPGRIFVEVFSIIHEKHKKSYDLEILDYDHDTAVFWLDEGGFPDYWIGDECDFETPGHYVIEGIAGDFYKGDGWMTDDDMRFHYESIRKATVDEIVAGYLDAKLTVDDIIDSPIMRRDE